MKLTTSRGNAYEAITAFGPISTGELIIRLRDGRPISELAAAFEGCERFTRESDGSTIDFTGYTELIGLNRAGSGPEHDIVIITLAHPERS